MALRIASARAARSPRTPTSSLWGGEGCQDFGLLALRDLEEVQSPSELRCDLIEFCGGDPEVPVGLLKAERRRAGLGGRSHPVRTARLWAQRSCDHPARSAQQRKADTSAAGSQGSALLRNMRRCLGRPPMPNAGIVDACAGRSAGDGGVASVPAAELDQ
jgi:hypothetical protein